MGNDIKEQLDSIGQLIEQKLGLKDLSDVAEQELLNRAHTLTAHLRKSQSLNKAPKKQIRAKKDSRQEGSEEEDDFEGF